MDKNSNRFQLPKGPWTRNLDGFPKNFKEESILQYKDTSKHHLLGYRLFKANKTTNMFIHYSQDGMKSIVKAKVDAAMKKKSYCSSTFLDHNGIISGGYCDCIGGVSGRCKHVFSILWQLLDYIRDERSYIPEDISCTSKHRKWGTGSVTLVDLPLHQMNFLKPDPAKRAKSTEKKWDNRRKLSNKHRIAETLTQEVLREHVEVFKSNGLSFLGEVIEANEFKPVTILNPNENAMNVTNEDYNQDINIPFLVKWEHEFRQIVEEYDLPLMLLKHCQISEKDAAELEKQTRSQNQCKLWYDERKKRLTASKFGEVIKRKLPVNQKMIKNIWPKKRIQTGIMKMGIENEKRAVDKYLEKYPHYKAFSCGICVNAGVPFLAASPDRIVLNTLTNEYHVLEIKTLVKGGLLLNLNISECIARGFAPFLEVNRSGEVHLKETHSYYFQVQGQMALTGLNKCHFMVDSFMDMFIEEIDVDENLWVAQSLPILTKFYFDHFEKSLEMLSSPTL